MYHSNPPDRPRSRMSTLAAEAHLALTFLHAQGVVYHLTDEEERSLLYAGVHGAAAVFSGAAFLRHWKHGRG